MFPSPLFELFGVGVNAYLLLYFMASLAALVTAVRLGASRGFNQGVILNGWLLLCVCAFSSLCVVGGLQVLLMWAFPKVALRLGPLLCGSLSFPAILGAAAALYFLLRRRPIGVVQRRDAMDLFAPCLALTECIARLGCFTAGCCHGIPAYDWPLAVTFRHPETACLYPGIPVHPTQLYFSAGNGLLFLLYLALWRRPSFRGGLLWMHAMGYGVLRFGIEFVRGTDRPHLGPFYLAQWICLALIIAGGLMLVRHWRQQIASGKTAGLHPVPNPL